MWRILGTLACMLVCGAATLFVTIIVLTDLGSKHHGNYEYYGINYPALVWGPAVLGFLAPGVLVWYLAKRGYTNVWKVFGTLPLMVCNVGIVMLVLIIYGVVIGMSAGGDSKSVEKSKNTIFAGIVGLLILLSAWSISRFVIDRVLEGTGAKTTSVLQFFT